MDAKNTGEKAVYSWLSVWERWNLDHRSTRHASLLWNTPLPQNDSLIGLSTKLDSSGQLCWCISASTNAQIWNMGHPFHSQGHGGKLEFLSAALFRQAGLAIGEFLLSMRSKFSPGCLAIFVTA